MSSGNRDPHQQRSALCTVAVASLWVRVCVCLVIVLSQFAGQKLVLLLSDLSQLLSGLFQFPLLPQHLLLGSNNLDRWKNIFLFQAFQACRLFLYKSVRRLTVAAEEQNGILLQVNPKILSWSCYNLVFGSFHHYLTILRISLTHSELGTSIWSLKLFSCLIYLEIC